MTANSARTDICTTSWCNEDSDPADPDGYCPMHADDAAREWDRYFARLQNRSARP